MNWDAVGAIGEVLGASVVIVTLGYLAVQTRQIRKSGQHTATLAVTEAHSRWRSALYNNRDLADLLIKANLGEALTDAQKLQLHYLHFELFIACVVGHYTQETDTPRAEVALLASILSANPSVLAAWNEQRVIFYALDPVLVDAVNSRMNVEN
ncbi:MAG: hypothetical protein ABJK25_13820 [Halieaceae bacterium]